MLVEDWGLKNVFHYTPIKWYTVLGAASLSLYGRLLSLQPYTRLEPRGGSLVSGRGAFRPGFTEDTIANYLAGFDGRRKRVCNFDITEL